MDFRKNSLLLVGLFGAIVLSACGNNTGSGAQSVGVGLEYANTSLGYRNSGALSAGRLFLWDKEENRLTDLVSPVTIDVFGNSTPAELEASNVRGFSISANADVSEIAKANIGAAVSRDISFKVKQAVRKSNKNLFTAVSDEYKRQKNAGIDPFRTWRVEQVISNPNRFNYVVLYDEVLADSEEVQIRKEVSGDLGLKVPDGSNGQINVKLSDNITAKCSGNQVVCYVNAMVMEAFLNENKNLDYAPEDNYSRSALVLALRKGF